MLKNENIICISSIDWDFIWQGHQEIMSAFAKNRNRVLFIENTGVRVPGIRDISRIGKRIKNWFSGIDGIRRDSDNLYIFSPLILPFPYLRIAKWINRRLILSILDKWIKVMNFSNPVIWVFLPTPLSLDIINNLNYKVVIYYCIDNFRVSSNSAKKIKDSEIKLLKKADLVFVTSRELYNYSSQYNRKVHFFPFAVNFLEFEKVRLEKDFTPQELKDIRKPIIGYIGGIHKWVDLQLIKEAALGYPQYSFVFVGPVQTDISSLTGLGNVHFLGKKEHEKIPYFIKNFDACIIPYLITDYTNNVYPTKLNEYLAMGKPVISTDLPEIANFNRENNDLVFVGKDHEEFISLIPRSIAELSASLVEKRIAVAKKNSWEQRIEEMSNLTKAAIDWKNKISFDWQERFLKLYKKAGKKVFKIFLGLLAVYLLLFYTPLAWVLARPLRISQMPEKADCIVVFGGGVGASGKAGTDYGERVRFAVELYKNGFAKNIIFSSGFMYLFNEPLVMKALAVSLGVPEGSVALENRANNTYQNVLFSKEILDNNKWNRIILVSSPYHMLRTSLVFKKIAKDIKVTYVPLPESSFFARYKKDKYGRRVWKQIDLRQIHGIIHEYIGILYYYWKGWI